MKELVFFSVSSEKKTSYLTNAEAILAPDYVALRALTLRRTLWYARAPQPSVA
jgi:hypothetical protein